MTKIATYTVNNGNGDIDLGWHNINKTRLLNTIGKYSEWAWNAGYSTFGDPDPKSKANGDDWNNLTKNEKVEVAFKSIQDHIENTSHNYNSLTHGNTARETAQSENASMHLDD